MISPHRKSISLFTGILFALSPLSLIAQYPNIQINNPYNKDPEEVSIAINPANPLNLAAGANLQYLYLSTNGGLSWRQSYMSSGFGVWGDPCVIFDRLGYLYFGHLSNPSSGGYWIDRIVVQSSSNGGVSWNSGAEVGYHPPVRQQDKEWLAADMTNSPYRDRIYAAWTEFDRYGSNKPTDSTRILFSRSTDHGQSWSGPVRVSDRGGNAVDADSTVEGAVPAIGPRGEVYLSWSGPLGIMFDKSTDGGATFGNDIFVSDQPGGWDFGIPGIYRANGMPITACDLSMSPFRGSIYISWSDQRYGADNTDLFFCRSTDGGESWSLPSKVNSDSGAHQQFFSWMAVDQSTGYIYIDYYDRRHTSGNATEVYLSRSTDGGSTFTDTLVSANPFTPIPGVFFGDYTNIAALHGHVYPIWMRLDSLTLSVWTALVNDQRTAEVNVRQGWNMISIPLDPDDKTVGSLFSSGFSPAFGYENGYNFADTLFPGRGYWYKFPAASTVPITGTVVASESVAVVSGWNLIGAPSTPAAVSKITSVPGGLSVSPFFSYDGNSYQIADSLRPGLAYWVRSNVPGTLFIAGFTASGSAGKIRIVEQEELPPPPPDPAKVASIPHQFLLEQNYPNPFNPSTVIRYSIPREGRVYLKLYNVYGQEIKTLVDALQHAGLHACRFGGDDLPSGVYFYRLVTGTFSETRKMVLIR
jgi:hypothetical protein